LSKVIEESQQLLADAGFRSSVVSIDRLPDLKTDLERLLEEGILSRDFYKARLSHFAFEPPADLPTAESIIVTAVPQPKVKVKFRLSGRTYPFLIPPTYVYDTDETAMNILSGKLKDFGYSVRHALLPFKLLAVRSGLAGYGRNNIAYIDGWGSFFRLKVFYSDALPPSWDSWQDPMMMDQCEKCSACLKVCPAKVISKERFLVDIERCLTFHNEGDDEFPEWIDPVWHNCLVGCLICQDICPMNKDLEDFIYPGEEFTEDQTRMILDGVPQDRVPDEMAGKLKRLYMWEYYDLLRRNLGVLIKKSESV
jgi:epoxyqueuosine reductase